MDQHAQAIAGYKAYLKALGKTKAELLAMAAALADGLDDVTITSISGDGTASSGQLSLLPRELKISAIMEVYAEGNSPRQLASVIDRSLYASPL
ncbi:MAG: hypothetical protein ACO3GP_06290 [Candidatus Limnocylindrus sp.]